MYQVSVATMFAGRRPGVWARVEWATVALIAACHGMWIAAGVLYGDAPVLTTLLMAMAIVLHASLQHEAIHRHPTTSTRWNEALVCLPLGLVVPYRRFRCQHLRHHNNACLTDPYDDPESFYIARGDWQRLPPMLRRLLAWNNILAVRLIIGPAVMTVTYLWAEANALVRPTGRDSVRDIRLAWALHGIGVIAVVLIVSFVFAMPLGIYLLAAYLAQSLLALRSFCEHRWAHEPEARSVLVERSLLGLLFLNNNLHLVHHVHPGLPWYALPAVYRSRRAEWLCRNHGYVFRGYGAVLRQFAFRTKEPVPHPVRTGR